MVPKVSQASQVVKNPPASAEDTGLTPGPHAMEQLSQNTTTTELGL